MIRPKLIVGQLYLMRHYEVLKGGVPNKKCFDDYVMKYLGRDKPTSSGQTFRVLAKRKEGEEEIGIPNSAFNSRSLNFDHIKHERIVFMGDNVEEDCVNISTFDINTDVPLCVGWNYYDESLLQNLRKD